MKKISEFLKPSDSAPMTTSGMVADLKFDK